MIRRTLTMAVMIGMTLTLSLPAQDMPLTRAEATEYQETSLYADVMTFIHQLEKQTPYLRVESMGATVEGRDIPLLIFGNPVPVNPSDLRSNNRRVIYFQANIHAGEVEGKEAVLMLMRDITAENPPRFLDKFIILVAPVFNADGNEKLSSRNRRDNGPELAGIRYNGWNLDLNRDGMKQESPEIQGLMDRVFRRWDPLLFVDCHTTNGSYHDEPVTYLWPMNPNGDIRIIEYMHTNMMPAVRKNLKKKYDILSIPYGNYMSNTHPEEGWAPAGPEPRYITNYYGLRNRFSILLENYAYADFKTRVRGNYYFLLSVLEYAYDHGDVLSDLMEKADRETIERGLNPAVTDSFTISCDLKPLGRNITIQGYELDEYQDDQGRTRTRKSDRKAQYTVPLYHNWQPKHKVRFPFGYFIPLNDQKVIENLLRHGILVERLNETVTLKVEAFKITDVKPDDPYGSGARSYQGHYMNTVKGQYEIMEKEFTAGTYFVPTGQPLGDLAAYLLEPESDDGLLVWNYFDRYITAQWSRQAQLYPVYKLYTPAPMSKTGIH